MTTIVGCLLILENPTIHKTYNVPFVAAEQYFIHFIGIRAAQEMQIITIDRENLWPGPMIANQLDPLTQFQDMFGNELVCSPAEAYVSIDTTVTPTISPTLKVPEALKEPLKTEFQQMVE